MFTIISRVNKHLQLISEEEKNVEQKRIDLVTSKCFDAKQIFQTIKISNLKELEAQNIEAFLGHYKVDCDRQFIYSFIYRYSGLIGFTLPYERFKNFVIPTEDQDLLRIMDNREHEGGARTIIHYKLKDALRDLFIAEIHYHFAIERSKKELMRDFNLEEYPLCKFKTITFEQLNFLDEDDAKRVWRRINLMDRNKFQDKNTKCPHFKSLIYPEDYMYEQKLVVNPKHINEQAIPQFKQQNQYLKNKKTNKYMKMPKQEDYRDFYQNYDGLKTYNYDRFITDLYM